MIDNEDFKKLFNNYDNFKNDSANNEKHKQILMITEITNNIFTDEIISKLAVVYYFKQELALEILNAFYTSTLLNLTKDINESLNNINKLKKSIEKIDKEINTS